MKELTLVVCVVTIFVLTIFNFARCTSDLSDEVKSEGLRNLIEPYWEGTNTSDDP